MNRSRPPAAFERGDVVVCPDGAMHLVWSVSAGLVHVIPGGSCGKKWRYKWRRHFCASNLTGLGETAGAAVIHEISEAIAADARKLEDAQVRNKFMRAAGEARRRRRGSIQSAIYA